MPVVPPLPVEQAPQSTQDVYQRIAETIGDGKVPLGYQMMGHVEPFLQDSYMNARKFVHDGAGKLDEKTRAALALASSSAMNCVHCVRDHSQKAQARGWTHQQVAEILSVVATCSMYNLYYKFRDLSGDEHFNSFSVGLRAHTFMKTSLGDQLVELICIIVSNINGCPACTSGHVAKGLKLGLTHEQIDEAVKISATIASFNVYHRTQ